MISIKAMEKEIIYYVYSSLTHLEKYLDKLKDLSLEKPEQVSKLNVSLKTLESSVLKMRRIANKLQLEFAANDYAKINRSLSLYYGMNNMVRPEILKSILSFSRFSVPVLKQQETISLH